MGTVADKLEYLSDTKELIRQAIIDQGVQVETTDSFRLYPEKISEIEGGGGGGGPFIEIREDSSTHQFNWLSLVTEITTIERV